jgi:hypothetical protein
MGGGKYMAIRKAQSGAEVKEQIGVPRGQAPEERGGGRQRGEVQELAPLEKRVLTRQSEAEVRHWRGARDRYRRRASRSRRGAGAGPPSRTNRGRSREWAPDLRGVTAVIFCGSCFV